MEGILSADRFGADYAEIDVQLSKDGVPVVVHDENLVRLAGVDAEVAELTAAELTQIETSSFRGTAKHPDPPAGHRGGAVRAQRASAC